MDEGGGAEPSLETQPKVLTPRDLEKIASILGMNHAPSTRVEYASQMSKYHVSSKTLNHCYHFFSSNHDI